MELPSYEDWRKAQPFGAPKLVSDWMRHIAGPTLGKGGYKIVPPKLPDNELSMKRFLSPEAAEFLKEPQANPEPKPELPESGGKIQLAKDKAVNLYPDEWPSLIPQPNIVQQDDYSCVAANCMSMCKKYSVGPNSLEEYKKILGTTREKSTSQEAVVDYLNSVGIKAVPKYNMGIDELRQCWYNRTSVMVVCQDYMNESKGLNAKEKNSQYGHSLIFIGGPLGDLLFFQDPSADNVTLNSNTIQCPGLVGIKVDAFLENWHSKEANGEEYNRFGIVCSKGEK